MVFVRSCQDDFRLFVRTYADIVWSGTRVFSRPFHRGSLCPQTRSPLNARPVDVRDHHHCCGSHEHESQHQAFVWWLYRQFHADPEALANRFHLRRRFINFQREQRVIRAEEAGVSPEFLPVTRPKRTFGGKTFRRFFEEDPLSCNVLQLAALHANDDDGRTSGTWPYERWAAQLQARFDVDADRVRHTFIQGITRVFNAGSPWMIKVVEANITRPASRKGIIEPVLGVGPQRSTDLVVEASYGWAECRDEVIAAVRRAAAAHRRGACTLPEALKWLRLTFTEAGLEPLPDEAFTVISELLLSEEPGAA